jgi:hypothetical protein
MGGAVVIPLVGLVFPILLGVGAVGFGAAIASWAGYRLWHDRQHHGFSHFLHR